MVSSETATAQDDSTVEHRHGTRQFPRGGHAVIIPYSVRRPVRVTVKDLSTGGIGLSHSSPLPAGARFLLQIPPKPGTPSRSMVCTVSHCRPEGPAYHIGAIFSGLVGKNKTPAGESSDEKPAETPTANYHMPLAQLIQEFRDRTKQRLRPEEAAILNDIERRVTHPTPGSAASTAESQPAPKDLPGPKPPPVSDK